MPNARSAGTTRRGQPGRQTPSAPASSTTAAIACFAGKTADALKLFKANVDLYPADANAYDSLGEGQVTAGLTSEAIASYRKALEMNPANTNAIKMLEKLGAR